MRPLDGITILELARVAPGEFCTMLLADMGADVLKIETPQGAAEDDRRAAFAFVNRNKRSLALNLKAPEGQAIFRRHWHMLGPAAQVAERGLELVRKGVEHGLPVYASTHAVKP